MRKLTSLLLVIVGLAFPFVVYFGMDKVAPPVFAMVLGSIWLIRAPWLIREPGGWWMVVVSLAYCAILGFSGESALLRWYPTLISLLLLSAFGLSLVYGPPLVERIARVREPDLPPQAIPYTRRVTQVWVGFFIFNAAMSAGLTLWGPLSWWTIYNGLLVHFIIGTLLVGEFLMRQRMRRRFA
ncbi:hypothetical protein [Dyella sp.]|uniref:COG4648 family protein n=1 Tax=Dyella sp. TaxID=1869338 RepID=UPI002ED00D09